MSTNNSSKQQELVDITFQIAFAVKDNKSLQEMSFDQLASWVSEKLDTCGFPTKRLGSSWGVLV